MPSPRATSRLLKTGPVGICPLGNGEIPDVRSAQSPTQHAGHRGSGERVPRDHPRRRIKAVADAALAQLLPTFDATAFTKNRQRLLAHDAGRALFDKTVWAADQGELLSDVHFSMDGTLSEAVANLGASGPRRSRRTRPRTTIPATW